MKNIYLLSFTGGSGGDFLCSQISKDNSFFPLESKMNPDSNSCDLENPFEKWNLDIKNTFISNLSISNYTLENIDLYFNEKNLIAPTHFFGNLNQVRLPRLKGIKLYNEKLSPLFYLLLWIKRWTSVRHFENKEDFFKIIEESSPNTSRFINATIDKIVDEIFTNRKYLYSFEIPALKKLHKDAINFVHNYFEYYKLFNTITDREFGWIPYNIDNLYLDPINNLKEFSQLFNMEQSINSEIIAEYYSQNLRVIEETFGEPYEVFISNNWLLKLKEWVKQQCPNAYSVNFKIL